MNQDFIDQLIVKLIEDTISNEEADILLEWLEVEEHKYLFDEFVQINYLINSKVEFDYKKSLKTIQSSISQKSRVKRFTFYKYTAVAAATVAIFTYLTLFNTDTNPEITPPVIVNSNIKIGSDKATLTLGDGSNIRLEKGKTYESENLVSDGKELDYERKNEKVSRTKTIYNVLTIPRGGEYMIKLSDGTRVWLNSESKLKYPVSFKANTPREIELIYGEAYLEVSPSTSHNGAVFLVEHQSQIVEVVGTEFNISAYADDYEIATTLVEGSVKIIREDAAKEFMLSPNQQFVLNRKLNTHSVSKVNVKDYVSWKKGVFSFKNRPLHKIMKTLSRWYDVDFIFENKDLKQKTFRGVLTKQQHLEDILDIIKGNNNFNYEINGSTLILK